MDYHIPVFVPAVSTCKHNQDGGCVCLTTIPCWEVFWIKRSRVHCTCTRFMINLPLSSIFIQDGTPTTKTFEHVASEIGAEEAEEVGVEHLLR